MNSDKVETPKNIRFSLNDLQSNPVATFVIENRTKIIYANGLAGVLVGEKDAEKLIGNEITELLDIDEKEYDGFFSSIGHASGSAAAKFEISKKGKKIEFHVIGSSIGGSAGSLKILYFVKNDKAQVPECEEKRPDSNMNNDQLDISFISAIDNFSSLVWIADLEAKFKYFNHAWLDYTGRSLEQETGDGCFAGIHHDDCQSFINVLRENVVKRVKFNSEFRLKDNNGEYRWMQCIASPYKDSNGKIVGYLGDCQDVNSCVASMKKLKDERDKLESYIDIAGTIVVALDGKGKITLINEKGCNMIGRKKEELIGADWFELCIPADNRAKVYSVYQRIISGQEEATNKVINNILTKNGLRAIMWSNSVLRGQKGEIIGTFSSGEDVSEERLKAQEISNKNAELERFNRLAVDRELKMVELKKKLQELENELKNINK